MNRQPMNILHRADRILLVLISLTGLGMLAELLWPHPLTVARLEGRTAENVEAENPPGSNPPEPFDAFASIHQRPLFRMDRTAFVAPEPATEPAERAPETAPVADVEFELDAVVITPGIRLAFLSVDGSPARKVRKDETIEGWTLAVVQPDGVRLVRRDESRNLPLRHDDAANR